MTRTIVKARKSTDKPGKHNKVSDKTNQNLTKVKEKTASTDNTAKNQVAVRNEKYGNLDPSKSFKKGQSGNPAGRPKGSRSKFAEAFVNDFLTDWENEGANVIERVRRIDPSTYLRVAASILPKELDINDDRQIDAFLSKFNPEQIKSALLGIRTIEAEAVLIESGHKKRT